MPMRFFNDEVLAGNAAGNLNGEAIDASNIMQISFVVAAAGSAPVGVVKVQVSNDEGLHGVTNWVDLALATATVTASGVYLIAKFDVSYRWLRCVFTADGGGSTGTISVRAKSNGF